MSWAPEARIIIPHARRASQSRSFSRSTPGHQRAVGCDVPCGSPKVQSGGCEPRLHLSGYWLEPAYPAEFQSLHPVLAFPPSLRVRSQRSREEHGTVRCRWSERLTAPCRGTPWTWCHRTPTDSQRSLGIRGAFKRLGKLRKLGGLIRAKPPPVGDRRSRRRSPGQKARQHRGAVSGQLTLHARVAEAPGSRCLPPSGCRARQVSAPCPHLRPPSGVWRKASCTSHRRTSLTHRAVAPHRSCASVLETKAPRGASGTLVRSSCGSVPVRSAVGDTHTSPSTGPPCAAQWRVRTVRRVSRGPGRGHTAETTPDRQVPAPCPQPRAARRRLVVASCTSHRRTSLPHRDSSTRVWFSA